MNPLVMVVEDDRTLSAMLLYNLEKAGFGVCEANDGEEALVQIEERRPDLVLLDWALPFVSGIEVCRQLRRSPKLRSLRVIMLTGRTDEADMIRSLNSGADDYVTKPFSTGELMARVRAVMRRSHPERAAATVDFADFSLDVASGRLTRGGRPVPLVPNDFRLMRVFMGQPRRVFSREELLDAVWGRDAFVQLRTVDVQVRRLRTALNIYGEVDLVRTVRGAGYSLDDMQE